MWLKTYDGSLVNLYLVNGIYVMDNEDGTFSLMAKTSDYAGWRLHKGTKEACEGVLVRIESELREEQQLFGSVENFLAVMEARS